MSKLILFQGDSITDCGRNREDVTSLGSGYAAMVSTQLGAEEPGAYTFINKGIGGNRSIDIYARMKEDILSLKPDYMSLLMGINDIWHDLGGRCNGLTAEKFEKIYELLISEVLEALPECKIMLMEPFFVEGTATCNTEAEPNRLEIFRTEVPKRAAAVRRIAEKYHLPFVTLQDKFDEVCKAAPADYWFCDGIHPAAVGHWIIKDAWLKAFQAMK